MVFVVTSSLNCKSVDYCNTRHIRAPRMSALTDDNVHFASTRTMTSADAPSHCSLFAKRCT